MPTYQYVCTECAEPLEAVQSFTDAPLTECPACGGRLRKVFSAVGVVFKGSGFYRNDSRSNGSSGTGSGGDSPKTTTGAGESKNGSSSSGDSSSSSSSSSSDSGSSSTSSSSSGSSKESAATSAA